MALVRKGSRQIDVDGTAYRWRLRGGPTYIQGLAWLPCMFAVERADTPGRRCGHHRPAASAVAWVPGHLTCADGPRTSALVRRCSWALSRS
jgi:hypothetical protein